MPTPRCPASVFVRSGANRTLILANNFEFGFLPASSLFRSMPNLDISQFAGQQIQLEFEFRANNDLLTAEGFYVDDVVVNANSRDTAVLGVLADGVFTQIADNRTIFGGLPNGTAASGFVPLAFNLNQFVGKQIQLQFKFDSNATGQAEGWFVDDVKLHIGQPTTLTLTAGQTVTGLDFGGVQAANSGGDTTVPVGQPLNLTGVITDPNPHDGSNLTGSWTVTTDNGQVVPGSNNPNLSFTPTRPGNYTVTFTVIDHDDANRPYVHSSIITAVDATAPTVTTRTFNAPGKVVFQFSENVSFDATQPAFLLENLTTGLAIPTSQMSFAYDPLTFRATFTFAGAGQALPNGVYRATLLDSRVTDQGGNTLDGDADGQAGANFSFTFHQLAGDASGDGKVDAADFDILRNNFGGSNKTPAQGDLNGDTKVDFADFQILERNFGRVIDLTPIAPAPVPTTTAPEVLAPAVTPTTTPPPLPTQPRPAPAKRPPAPTTTPTAPRTVTTTPAPKPAAVKVSAPPPTPATPKATAPARSAPAKPQPAKPTPSATARAFSTTRLKSKDLLA